MDEENKKEENNNDKNTKDNQLETNIEKEKNDNKVNNNKNSVNEIKENNEEKNDKEETIENKDELKELTNENNQKEEKNNNDKNTFEIENKINIEEINNINNINKNEKDNEENKIANSDNQRISENKKELNIISDNITLKNINNKEKEINKNKIMNNKEDNQENKIIDDDQDQIQEDMRKVKLQESKEDEKKYLVNLEEEKEYEKLINEQIKPSEDSDDSEEEETFPFCFLGDVQKKGETLGFFNNRYLEIDSIKGLLKRYASSKEYPTKPIEIIPIKNLKALKKVKKLPNQEFYEFHLSYIPENEKKEKLHVYRVRHLECRTKWFEGLLKLYKHLAKGEPLPPINKNKLIFIDDQVGINQEIRQDTNKLKKRLSNKNSVFLRNFKIISELGEGAFGTVFKVQHILTEKIYAMKVMNKNYIIQKKYLHYVVSEFEIMKSLSGFPFVIDLHYCFQSANYLFMVIDICPGGDFDNLKYINNLKLFFAELILGFEHIHKHHIVYRDLKPENILLDPYGHIKICDFNLAKAGVSKQKRAISFCGSPMYLSPEMLDPEGVDQRADIYGIGLLIYELVTGKPAFMAKNLDALHDKIRNNRIDFQDPKLKGDMKDLLQKILVLNPDDRITIEEMKKHPYFKDISFVKVFKREYGPIIIKKKDETEFNYKLKKQLFNKNILDNKDKINNEQDKEKKSQDDFKEHQKKLDANKDYSFLDGKISVREMKKDQKRAMKNYVREFYYIKHEDQPQTEEFHLTVNGLINLEGI